MREGEFEHLFVEVDDGAGLPVGGDGFCIVADDLSVGGDALTQEGRLHEAALAHVQGLFAGEEAFAEDGSGALQDDAAMVFGGVLEEEVFDESGVAELVDVAAEDTEVNEVSEVAGGQGHVLGGHAAEETSAEETGQEWWAGRVKPGGAGTDVYGDRYGRRCGYHAGL